MKKQLTALLLAGALALSAAVVPASAASVEQFTDVPSGSWFFSHVEYATEKGLLKMCIRDSCQSQTASCFPSL